MKYTNSNHGKYTVIKVEENLVNDPIANEFKQVIYDLMDKGEKYIAIDCSDMQFIGSAGIGKLLLAYKRMSELGGTIAIVNLHPDMKDLFVAFKLQDFLTICDSLDDL
ncbi:anti-sigma B factor antagonist [Brevinema andersonii]|uniref:Anti-sigma B factor antagonist n=1 Tax=Brevinema andersonii TaxID=34097 RepID=A0A1I1D469_BREAD|nr:STAS domain-containing protein [Brevinema andersonii]SFB67590.1 anti-sigma B factor antagonist [Brevinema andersonii]